MSHRWKVKAKFGGGLGELERDPNSTEEILVPSVEYREMTAELVVQRLAPGDELTRPVARHRGRKSQRNSCRRVARRALARKDVRDAEFLSDRAWPRRQGRRGTVPQTSGSRGEAAAPPMDHLK